MLQPFAQAFEDYARAEAFLPKPPTLAAPIDYILSLGGKRLRPLLCLMSSDLFDKGHGAALPQALAIEVFHNFSLMHDDIMDAAPLRRGRDTVHKRFGVNRAILSGDAMLILSYAYVTRGLGAKRALAAHRLFSKTALQVCRGQQMDLDFERQENIAITDYLRMIKFKTAVLMGASMALGAMAGGASKKEQKRLRSLGNNMGMAFQLQDDLLDVFGDPSKTGKQMGGDIVQNKKTYLFLKALELGNARTKQELTILYTGATEEPTHKVDRVREIYQALAVEQHCRSLIDRYTDKALEALTNLEGAAQAKQQLVDLFRRMSLREF